MGLGDWVTELVTDTDTTGSRGDQFLQSVIIASDREGWGAEGAAFSSRATTLPGYHPASPSPSWWAAVADSLGRSGRPRASRLAAIARGAAGTQSAWDVSTVDVLRGTLDGTLEDVSKASRAAQAGAQGAGDLLSRPWVQATIGAVVLAGAAGYVINAVKR